MHIHSRKYGREISIFMTVEELHMIAHDSISDYHYTNKLIDMIKRKSERLGNQQGEAGS